MANLATPKKYSLRDRDGALHWVTEAERQRRRRAQWAARRPEQIARDRIAKHPDGQKTCPRCGRALPFTSFADAASRKDGLNDRCFGCMSKPSAEASA